VIHQLRKALEYNQMNTTDHHRDAVGIMAGNYAADRWPAKKIEDLHDTAVLGSCRRPDQEAIEPCAERGALQSLRARLSRSLADTAPNPR
jgi:hypothetical protein